MSGDRQPVVKFTEWERTSAAGNRYFSGYFGSSQLLIFDDGEKPHPTRPDETVHVGKVLLQEKEQPPHQNRRRMPNHGQRTHDRPQAAPAHAEPLLVGSMIARRRSAIWGAAMSAHPLPGLAVAKMPACRLIVRHMPRGLWDPYNVTRRCAAAMVFGGRHEHDI